MELVAATYRVVPSTSVVTSSCSPRTGEILSRVHAVAMPAAQSREMFPVLVAEPEYPWELAAISRGWEPHGTKK